MAHSKPIQTSIAFAWVFGHTLVNYPNPIMLGNV